MYGLSNALLDSPWHTDVRSKARLEQLIERGKRNETVLLRLLSDRVKAPVDQIKSDRLPFAKAHSISAPFIILPDYGTRSSSVAIRDSAGSWRFRERRFDAGGDAIGDSAFRIIKA